MEEHDSPSATTIAPVSKRGVLDPHLAERYFRLTRVDAGSEVAQMISHHWLVRWDASDEPYAQDVLAHPNVQVATELQEQPDGTHRVVAEVHGVVSGVFRRQLLGRGRVHGIKFRAGTFRGLLGTDVSSITDRILPAVDVFGPAWEEVAARAIDADDDTCAARLFEDALLERLPEEDPPGSEVAALVERTEYDRTLTRAAQLARLAGVTTRTLQRTFGRYVGVSPKWVVRRFRLHEAAERLAAGVELDLAELAAELGYSDQAHLTNDFRAMVGRTPASYARDQVQAAAGVGRRGQRVTQ